MVESFGQCPNLRKTAPKLFHAPLQRFRNMMKMFGSKWRGVKTITFWYASYELTSSQVDIYVIEVKFTEAHWS